MNAIYLEIIIIAVIKHNNNKSKCIDFKHYNQIHLNNYH